MFIIMQYFTVIVFIAFCFMEGVLSLPILGHSCSDQIPVEESFSMRAYSGKWDKVFEYEKTYSNFQQCMIPGFNNLTGTADLPKGFNGTGDVTMAKLVSNNTDANGKLKLYCVNGIDDMPFWILSTDYITYAVVYSCKILADGTNDVTLWVAARSPPLNAETLVTVNDVIKKANLKISFNLE